MPGDGESELARLDEALRRFDAGNRTVLDPDAGDFALLDDVDAAGIRRAGVAPGDGVVPHRPAARLQQPAVDREAGVGRAVEIGNPLRDLVAGDERRVDPVQAHRIAAAHGGVDVGRRVDEIQHAARAVHHVKVEILR